MVSPSSGWFPKCPQFDISYSQVCLPTIVKDCGPVALKERRGISIVFFSRPDFERIVMQVEGKESCVDVARTVCTEVTQPSSGCDIVNSSLNRQIWDNTEWCTFAVCQQPLCKQRPLLLFDILLQPSFASETPTKQDQHAFEISDLYPAGLFIEYWFWTWSSDQKASCSAEKSLALLLAQAFQILKLILRDTLPSNNTIYISYLPKFYCVLSYHICCKWLFSNKMFSVQSEESVDNELCYYTYTDGQVEGEVFSLLLHY